MKDKYIGIFDSGVGGLTVVKHILEAMPDENIVFLADNKNVPYGDKSREQIISFSLNNISILNRYDLKAVVIACNTSDSISRNILEEKYDIPIFGVIGPAVKTAYDISENKNIAVLATKATINSQEYEKKLKSIDEKCQVYSIACPELVPLIEQGKYHIDDKEMNDVLNDYLKPIEDADTVILGCTHYDLIKDTLKHLRSDLKIVSSSRCVVDILNNYLKSNDLLNTQKKKDIYLTTKMTDKLLEVSKGIIEDIDYIKTDA